MSEIFVGTGIGRHESMVGGAPKKEESGRKKEENLEERTQNLRKEVFQLANHYIVFQGVIFTAVFGGSSALKCHYKWLAFGLSMVAGLLNLSALLTIMLEYLHLLSLQDKELTGKPALAPLRTGDLIINSVRKLRRMVTVFVSMALFIAFFVMVLDGCWNILCGNNDSGHHSGSANCIRFCDRDAKCMSFCPEWK